MIKILFEDNQVIVAVKTPGILSQADVTGDKDMLTEIKAYLKKEHNKPGNVFLGLVHRLDKNVGGVMVFAKTSKAAARLSRTIIKHEFHKTYLAVVIGKNLEKEKTLKHYLVKSEEERKSVAYDSEVPGSKYAELSFRVIGEDENLSLLEVNLITGRAHQIRVQLSKNGHPIVGDKLYIEGVRDSNSTIALWAYKLTFIHPITREPMTFISMPPREYPWNLFNIKDL